MSGSGFVVDKWIGRAWTPLAARSSRPAWTARESIRSNEHVMIRVG
jgi:hypothetical protein